MRDHRRNLLRALVLGTLSVSLIYLLLNAAFLSVLGLEGVTSSSAVAADTVRPAFPDTGERLVSILVCISTLGAVHGLIFTGGRISYALAEQYDLSASLKHWNAITRTPICALVAQGVMALIITIVAGSFSNTVVYTTSVVWFFFFLSGAAVIVLRHREPEIVRPYKTTLYPFTPIVFCASCLFLLWSALAYDFNGSLVSIAICLLGLPLYLLAKRGTEDLP